LVFRQIFAALVVFVLTAPLPLRADSPIFSSRDGLALGGYDVVALVEERGTIAGLQDFALMWKGVVWRFATSQNQARFEANPRAYAPVFGGYCAYAMSQGHLAIGDPHMSLMRNGRLYLLNNPSVRDIWLEAAPQLLVAAQANWPMVLRD
jgi:hypothetical protein